MVNANDVHRILSTWRERFADFTIQGYTAADVDAYSASLAKPLPEPIKALYRAVTPEAWDSLTNGQGEPALLPLERLAWNNSLRYDDEGIEDNTGPGEPSWIVFGRFGYGDMLVWSASSSPRPGAIIYVFHEGDDPLILGASLGEWLDRLMNCDGMEYADKLDALEDSGLPQEVQSRFRAQHAQLNPSATGS